MAAAGLLDNSQELSSEVRCLMWLGFLHEKYLPPAACWIERSKLTSCTVPCEKAKIGIMACREPKGRKEERHGKINQDSELQIDLSIF